MLIILKDTVYSTAKEKAEFIAQEVQDTINECLEVIQYSEEVMLESLVHFCNTGKFLTTDHVNTLSS